MNNTIMKFGVVAIGFATLIAAYIFAVDEADKVLRNSITKTTQASNAAITKIFVNELFPVLEEVLNISERQEGLSGDDLQFVDDKVRTFMLGTDILKTKIFNLDGTTLYSTEHKQIGETRKNNEAFQKAAKGGMGSQITHKGKFSAIDEIVFERDLVASYLPVRDEKGLVVGVTEIYTDRTQEIARIPQHLSSLQRVLMVSLAFSALVFAIQFWSSLFEIRREDG